MIVNLTQKYIDTELHIPAHLAKLEFVDGGNGNGSVPGLYVLVSSTSQGQGTYYLRYKDSTGKTCHKKIGRTSDVSLAAARAKAKTLRAEIALGADPRAEQKKQREALTYAVFFDEHYLPYVKPRKRSWKRDEELYRLRIKDVLGSKKLNAITRQQIQSFHTSLLEEGLAPATANHHVKLIKHSLNLAIDWNMLEKNPAARIPLFQENNQISHFMDAAEVSRLLTILRTDENRPVCNIAMFLLSTGCRLNEVLSAKWTDVDMVKQVFVLRASNSKSKKQRAVPLNSSALEVLRLLDDTQGKFEYLFINHGTGKPYGSIAKVWDRIRKEAGLPHLRLHDLRHQYASFLVNDGRTLYEVQQILGHSDPKVTMRYAHLSTKALLDAANSASVAMQTEAMAAA